MSTFDPMAAAIDWLDFYRAGSLSIVDLYAPEAALECECGGLKVIRGRAAIFEYWRRRLNDWPAGELIELQPADAAILVTYQLPQGRVLATLFFDSSGKIARHVCGPTA
jgi:hypothetical protein